MGETISLTPSQIKLCKEQFKTPFEFTRKQIDDNTIIRVLDNHDIENYRNPRPTPLPKRSKPKKKTDRSR